MGVENNSKCHHCTSFISSSTTHHSPKIKTQFPLKEREREKKKQLNKKNIRA